jgi:hypothetical protein
MQTMHNRLVEANSNHTTSSAATTNHHLAAIKEETGTKKGDVIIPSSSPQFDSPLGQAERDFGQANYGATQMTNRSRKNSL